MATGAGLAIWRRLLAPVQAVVPSFFGVDLNEMGLAETKKTHREGAKKKTGQKRPHGEVVRKLCPPGVSLSKARVVCVTLMLAFRN